MGRIWHSPDLMGHDTLDPHAVNLCWPWRAQKVSKRDRNKINSISTRCSLMIQEDWPARSVAVLLGWTGGKLLGTYYILDKDACAGAAGVHGLPGRAAAEP